MIQPRPDAVRHAGKLGAPFDAHVDLGFRLRGDKLPLDHGYALFGALCRLLPVLG